MNTSTFKPRAILFDLDGTLIESAPEIADAVNDTLRQLKWPEVNQNLIEKWIGQGTQELLLKALAHVNNLNIDYVRKSEWVSPALHLFKTHYAQRCGTRSQLYPHVKETLNTLKAQGIKLAIVTNKESAYTNIVLDKHGLTDYFDIIICGDTLSTKKPDPAGIEHCLNTWNIPASQALFVGDSSIDAQTAKAYSVKVWLLPYGYNMGEPIQACQPDQVINDFSALNF